MATVRCNSGKGNVGPEFLGCNGCKHPAELTYLKCYQNLQSQGNQVYTFWASGENGTELYSSGYGSCIGMALIDPEGGLSVLTHCWGTGSIPEAVADATEILGEYWENEPGRETEAIVFGGASPVENSRQRIDAIAAALAAQGCPARTEPRALAKGARLRCGQRGSLVFEKSRIKTKPQFGKQASETH